MKKTIPLILFTIFSIISVSAQNSPVKNDPAGKWKFEAPYAPEGYTAGIVEVGFAEKSYTASMVFAGSDYKFKGEKVKFENDSIFFTIYIEGQDVTVSLKMQDGTKMTGRAVYSEGEVPLTLTKAVEKK